MRTPNTVLTLAAILSMTAAAWAGPVAAPVDQETPLLLEWHAVPGIPLRSASLPADLLTAIEGGADYLQATQSDITEDNAGNGSGGTESPDDPEDGGWDWVLTTPPDPVFHSTGASPTNIYGETARGLYYAYLLAGDAGHFTAMTDAANAIIAVPSNVNSMRTAADMAFLLLYNALPGVAGTAYEDSAKAKYDARIAEAGSATALATTIRDTRGVTQGYPNGIIAWDIGKYVEVAAMLDERFGGYASDADDMAEVLWQDSFNDNPGLFDVVDDAGWDPTYTDRNFWWYSLGIAGLIDAFVASGTHTSELPGLATRITDSQYASGAISFSYGANTADEDWQSTAYGAYALGSYDLDAYRAEIGEMGTWLVATRDSLTGGWRYSDDTHYPQVGGENVYGLYFAYLAADYVAAEPDGDCLSVTNTCETVPVMFNRTDTSGARGVSVTFQLSAELTLCSTPTASIVQGTWLSGYTNKVYQVVDNGGGSYTVDQSILGTPCGITTGGELFTVDVMAAGGDGTGTITITSVIVRDCVNDPLPAVAGDPATITIDTDPPTTMDDLAALQDKSGNGSDGTTEIALSFGAPVDADTVMVFRKGFGDYPEYDDGTGVAPTAPTSPANAVANGWALTGVTATGQADEPTARDFWYYVAFTADACGNVSAVSNMTGGTLNYHLGDVTNGVVNGNGDNLVAGNDLSHLGANYGITLGSPDALNYLDVGPTTDYSVDARPTTDNKVDFEDLMMFAINYGLVSRTIPTDPVEAYLGDPRLALAVDASGDRVFARLLLEDHGRTVQGAHASVNWDPAFLELVGVTQGTLLGTQDGPIFFGTIPGGSRVAVDVARVGRQATLVGAGEVAVLEFRRLGGTALPTLNEAALRDVNNRPATRPVVPGEGAEEPTVSGVPITEVQLVGARPNPFGRTTEIVFRIPSTMRASVRIHDVTGRLVRTLLEGSVEPGEHRAVWDGRTEDGAFVGSGIYFTTLRAGDVVQTRKLLYTR